MEIAPVERVCEFVGARFADQSCAGTQQLLDYRRADLRRRMRRTPGGIAAPCGPARNIEHILYGERGPMQGPARAWLDHEAPDERVGVSWNGNLRFIRMPHAQTLAESPAVALLFDHAHGDTGGFEADRAGCR